MQRMEARKKNCIAERGIEHRQYELAARSEEIELANADLNNLFNLYLRAHRSQRYSSIRDPCHSSCTPAGDATLNILPSDRGGRSRTCKRLFYDLRADEGRFWTRGCLLSTHDHEKREGHFLVRIIRSQRRPSLGRVVIKSSTDQTTPSEATVCVALRNDPNQEMGHSRFQIDCGDQLGHSPRNKGLTSAAGR